MSLPVSVFQFICIHNLIGLCEEMGGESVLRRKVVYRPPGNYMLFPGFLVGAGPTGGGGLRSEAEDPESCWFEVEGVREMG